MCCSEIAVNLTLCTRNADVQKINRRVEEAVAVVRCLRGGSEVFLFLFHVSNPPELI